MHELAWAALQPASINDLRFNPKAALQGLMSRHTLRRIVSKRRMIKARHFESVVVVLPALDSANAELHKERSIQRIAAALC